MATKVAFLPSCSPSFCGYTVQQPTPCNTLRDVSQAVPRDDQKTRQPHPAMSFTDALLVQHILVGGFPHLEKYYSPWEGFSHILWKNKKCSTPPTSATCMWQEMDSVRVDATHTRWGVPTLWQFGCPKLDPSPGKEAIPPVFSWWLLRDEKDWHGKHWTTNKSSFTRHQRIAANPNP